MKIGDKVAFSKWAGIDGIGKIVGASKDGKTIAVKTRFKTVIVNPVIDDIVVIKEKKWHSMTLYKSH